ncbi:DNA-directed RNA polymerase subunit M [Ignisphaera sp. 4213-co]|uniref:DNA-directed RNA polymerase subunit M n=1 Tax=Ignisphaera cupida TaxID=3050454 RepID=A0ABD4Z6B3_9CREN|nr:DNA-directed RNA polymerase subunit M [Ignisphaera sp. 4213-co]MDK6028440.1 DNA-directed RNA polymerase subunit M [Ignisphaera sp. 4213-co]
MIKTQFCPRCGGLMKPIKKEDGSTILKCSKCGYELTSAGAGYTVGVQTSSSDRVKTTSVISEGKKVGRKKEEIEQEKEEYYKELFLELLHEEEYGGEET